MRNKENMSRDMKNAKYFRRIRCKDETILRRFYVLYKEYAIGEPKIFYGNWEIVLKITMEEFNKCIKNTGLKRIKTVPQKRLWELV